MKLRAATILGTVAILSPGCDPTKEADERVAVPVDWRLIDAATWSFRFPNNVDLRGKDDLCGGRNAPKEGCATAIEGPVYGASTADFALQTLDPYGDRGPTDWGQPLQLNGVLVYRHKRSGEERYVVTDRSGGQDKAVRFSHPNIQAGTENDPPEQPLLWASCKTTQGCQTVRAIVASVRFDDISQYCPPLRSDRAPPAFPRCPDGHS